MTVCKRCIMNDDSDPTIIFDENGYCNYCTEQLNNIGKVYFPGEEGNTKFEVAIKEIKDAGKGKEYDCIMGVSGGLDSAYLLYLGYKAGLRILAVHIDDGFDTEISKKNIEKLIEATGVHMETLCPDSIQMNALTKAYMRAGVPDLAIPQDNILFAFLYDFVRKNKIKYFLSGGNFALECILQQGNAHSAFDVINIKDIHKKFGDQPLSKLKFITSYHKYYDMKVLGLRYPRLLDYIDYNRDSAFKELKDFCGFEYYGHKHLENILTAFVQLYWLPKKFGVDKRTSHLSSMIVSGQMTREEALREISEAMYDEEVMRNYINIIKEQLCLSDLEFDEIMKAPSRKHTDFKYDKKDVVLRKIFK